MTVEQWQQLHQLVAKTVDTAGNHRYWSNTVKSLCCGSIKDKSYQSASHSRLSWCQSSLQGWSTVRKHFSSLVLYLEAASRTRSEISKSREQDDCYTVPHILNIPNVTLACNEAPAGIRKVILWQVLGTCRWQGGSGRKRRIITVSQGDFSTNTTQCL